MPMYTWSETGLDYIVQAIKKAPRSAERLMLMHPHLSIHYRRIWHLAFAQVAGLHRAVPSTTLDKAIHLGQNKSFTVC